jgi:hypothetical protein
MLKPSEAGCLGGIGAGWCTLDVEPRVETVQPVGREWGCVYPLFTETHRDF